MRKTAVCFWRQCGFNPAFVRWLQTQYAFPVRLPVYVRAAERLLCRDGDLACGTFLGPSDPEQEPYIRLAVGDYL